MTANKEVPEAIRMSRRILNMLKGEDVVLEKGLASMFGKEGLDIEDMNVEVLITIGGDGTILRSLQRTKAPIFGVNAGVLGFLTEVNEKGLKTGLERLLSHDYFIDERIKLRTTVSGERLFDATNESVVHTAHIAKIREFRIYVDDQVAMQLRADGVIVSTPTGSARVTLWRPGVPS